jgi:hypothetical protein
VTTYRNNGDGELTLRQRRLVSSEVAREFRAWRRKKGEPTEAERQQIIAIGFAKARRKMPSIPASPQENPVFWCDRCGEKTWVSNSICPKCIKPTDNPSALAAAIGGATGAIVMNALANPSPNPSSPVMEGDSLEELQGAAHAHLDPAQVYWVITGPKRGRYSLRVDVADFGKARHALQSVAVANPAPNPVAAPGGASVGQLAPGLPGFRFYGNLYSDSSRTRMTLDAFKDAGIKYIAEGGGNLLDVYVHKDDWERALMAAKGVISYLHREYGYGENPEANPLTLGSRLPRRLQEQVLGSYVHRWTTGNQMRAWAYKCPVCSVPGGDPNGGVACRQYHPTIPLETDEQWLATHSFHVTKDGQLSRRQHHAEPGYMAEANPLSEYEKSLLRKKSEAWSREAQYTASQSSKRYYEGRAVEAEDVAAWGGVSANPQANSHLEGEPCDVCGGPLNFMGTLGNLEWYRCRNCGMEIQSQAPRQNPLTVAESGEVAAGAVSDAHRARSFRGERRGFYVGRAAMADDVVRRYGPEFVRESPRSNPLLMTVMGANPGRRRVARSSGGPKRKVTMSLEKFASFVKSKNDPKLWAAFLKKVKGYQKWTHGSMPKTVTVETVNVPGVSGLWMTYGMGREPEKVYVMPKGSKRKGAWKHPWTKMPHLKGDPEAGIILTKLVKGNKITDFLHG